MMLTGVTGAGEVSGELSPRLQTDPLGEVLP